MVIRRLEARDEAATRAFFERIPEDQRFFKEDVLDPETCRAGSASRASVG
jgi:hypothetical protein